MKNLKTLCLIFFAFCSISAVAQKKPTSSIRFTTSNQEPISVILNDRDFNRVGKVIMFNDLPKKRQSVQIYAITQDRTGQKKGKLIYSGVVKLDPGKKYEAILDIRTQKLRMKTVRNFTSTPPMQVVPSNNLVVSEKSSDGLNTTVVRDKEIKLTSAMKSLKADMGNAIIDKDKIDIALKFSKLYKLNCEEAKTIAQWLNFDDSKLTFVKGVSAEVSDPQNLSSIAEVFTYESNKTEFLNSIK